MTGVAVGDKCCDPRSPRQKTLDMANGHLSAHHRKVDTNKSVEIF